VLAAHRDDVALDPALFQRVKAVWDARATLALEPDQQKLLEDTWREFVRGGALLPKDRQERLRKVNAELAGLSVKFGSYLLKETDAYRLVIEKKEDLAGLPDRVVAGAAEAVKKAGLDGKWLFTQAPSLWPFLQDADNRELRRQVLTAYTTRADHGDEADNEATLARIAALRAERAQLPAKAVAAREARTSRRRSERTGRTSRSSPGTGSITRRRSARRASDATVPPVGHGRSALGPRAPVPRSTVPNCRAATIARKSPLAASIGICRAPPAARSPRTTSSAPR
jgi:hypothetical protein